MITLFCHFQSFIGNQCVLNSARAELQQAQRRRSCCHRQLCNDCNMGRETVKTSGMYWIVMHMVVISQVKPIHNVFTFPDRSNGTPTDCGNGECAPPLDVDVESKYSVYSVKLDFSSSV